MSGETANILIVDDEPANLLALEVVLGDLGQNLVRASSGEEALRRLLEAEYAAILLDVQMGGMDGFECARLIRSRPRSRHTPIIFLTAFESEKFPLLEAYELGAVDYIVKPLVPQILRAKVTFFVEFFRQAAELKRAERRAAEASVADRQRFLFELGAATQTLTDPEEVMAVAAQMLGRKLQASRCAYAEVEADSDRFTIRHDFTDGCPSTAGEYHLSLFGSRAAADMRAGRTLVVRDVDRELSADNGAETFNAIGIKAIVCCPLVKSGRLAAMMAVHQTAPRAWTAEDVSLVEAVAERCWAHIERARAERQLRESEEKFRQLAETIPQLAWIARPDGHIFWYNRRWFEYTGTTPADMEGWGWQSVHDPAVLPDVMTRWTASIRSGEPFDMVFPLKSKDGRFRPFLTLVMPLKDRAGRVVQWFGTNTDISQQKAAEDLLREEGRRKDEFIAMFAHELRNPLAPIANAVQLLSLKQDAATVAKARAIIDRQAKQLSQIVGDLLEVSRVALGKVVIRNDRVDLAELTRTVTGDEVRGFEAAGLTLLCDTPETPVWVSGDRTRLIQVLGNLLANARKYTGRGGRVTVGVTASASAARLKVRDTGRGIEPDLLPRLFEPFTQADQGLARTEGGLGLGLALVKGLVDLHGGSVTAESGGAEQGAIFTVSLPRIAEPKALVPDPAPAGATGEPARKRRLRVLVIEDNRDSADSLQMLLELCGCEVTVAYTGPEGLKAAKGTRPDLVLCDIGLPGMSGYEIARELNAERTDKEPLLVALTGYGRDEDREKAEASGFDRHFVKPLDPAALSLLLAGVN